PSLLAPPLPPHVPPSCPTRRSSDLPSATIRSNSSAPTKKYSTPSVSPGRGARVVTDTESHTSGWWARSSLTTVLLPTPEGPERTDRKSTRLNSSHVKISYAVFCLKK